MKPKGTALIKQSILMDDCIVGGNMTKIEFLSQTKGKTLFVQDIAVDKTSCLVLIDNPAALVNIPRKHIAAVYPFYKDTDGYLVCSEFDEKQKMFWKAKLYTECPKQDLMHQIALLYHTFPEFWKREKKGEFIWTY